MKSLRVILLSSAAMAVATAAQAADVAEPDALVIAAPEANISETAGSNYIAIRIGAAFADDTTFGLDAAAAVPTGIVNGYETGIVGGIAIGHDYGAISGVGIRAEIEVGIARAEVESHTVTALGATLSDDLAFGKTSVTYGLVNAALDYEVGVLRPYVTGGIGYAYGNFNNHGIVVDAATSGASGLPVGDVTAMDDSDWGLAWQVGAGLGYALNDRTTLEFGYRYFGTENLDLVAVDGTASSVDIRQHQALFGLRRSF